LVVGPVIAQVKVPPHPLMKHWMAVLRSAETPPPVFKATMVELGRLLLVEATRDWLSTLEVDANTPTGSSATVELIDTSEPVRIVPILRAGLALAESAPSVLPVTAMHHLGFKRDVTSLEPVPYLDALPTTISETSPVIIMDPIVATGGTSIAAIERVKQAGASEHNIRLLCANASARAMQTLSQKYKKLQVFSGSIDEEVDDQGMVLPGMGDAGDRAFNSPI
jgi:uracil phosphoribosyltransferase